MTERRDTDGGLDWSDPRTLAALKSVVADQGKKWGAILSTPARFLDSLADGFNEGRGDLGPRETFFRLARENRDAPRRIEAGAPGAALTVPPTPQPVTWYEDSKNRLVVTDGINSPIISAPQRKRLFRAVAECNGRDVAWADILTRLMREEGRARVNVETLQRNGRRLREDLRELGWRWHQDGTGARFDATPRS